MLREKVTCPLFVLTGLGIFREKPAKNISNTAIDILEGAIPVIRINDRLLLAALAGFFAALAANLSLYLINQALPGQNINMPQVTLEIFLNEEATQFLFIRILGIIWSTVIGGVYALAYLVALDLTGWNNLWLKALIAVNGTWLLGAGVMIKLMNIIPYTRNEPLSIAVFYFAHMLFATYLYVLVCVFGQERIAE